VGDEALEVDEAGRYESDSFGVLVGCMEGREDGGRGKEEVERGEKSDASRREATSKGRFKKED